MLLAHETTGDGPDLVLVHGITESRETWRPLVHMLGADHRITLIDLRGHGASPVTGPYDPITLATDLRETLSAALGERVDDAMIVGHSLGGVVVSAYAAMFPSRCVVNVDQPLRLSSFKGALAQLEPMLRGDEESFQAGINVMFDSMYGALPANEVDRLRSNRRATQQVVLGVWGTVFDSTVEELDAQVDAIASGVTTRYLSLHGTDPGSEYELWFRSALPTAEYEAWDALGHYPFLVDPQRFADRVREFSGRSEK